MKRLQRLAEIIEVEVPVNAPEHVIDRDVFVEVEIIEQPRQRLLNPHRRFSCRSAGFDKSRRRSHGTEWPTYSTISAKYHASASRKKRLDLESIFSIAEYEVFGLSRKSGRARLSKRLFSVRGAFLVGLLLIASLIFGISLPPLQDYPNHLARYWLIAGGASIPPTSSMFAIDWRYASTNIGADLIVVLLVAIVPYWLAGKLLLVGAFAGPPAAAAWLNKILFGRWTWWSLSFLLLAWTTTSVIGFVNYQLSLAAALLFACLDTRILWSPVPKFVARIVFAAVSLIIHPFGLVFYILLLLALTIGQTWSGLFGRKRLLRIARDAVWPIVIWDHTGGVASGSRAKSAWRTRDWDFILHPRRIVAVEAIPYRRFTFRYLSDLGRLPVFCADPGHLPVCVDGEKSRNTCGNAHNRPDYGGAFPNHAFQGRRWRLVDRRLPLMATYLLLAGALPQPFNNRFLQRAAAAGVFGIAVARTLWIGAIWSAREADVRAVEAALSEAPLGAAILDCSERGRRCRDRSDRALPAGCAG